MATFLDAIPVTLTEFFLNISQLVFPYHQIFKTHLGLPNLGWTVWSVMDVDGTAKLVIVMVGMIMVGMITIIVMATIK